MNRRPAGGVRGRRAMLPSLLVLFLASCCLHAAGAAAAPAKFVWDVCDPQVPGGSPPAVVFSTFPPDLHADVLPYDTCASPGGSLGLSQVERIWEGAYAWLDVAIPATPGGYVETETISAAITPGPGANDRLFVAEPGWPIPGTGESQRILHLRSEPAPVGKEAGGSFRMQWNCDGEVPPYSCGAGAAVSARYIAVTEVDPSSPTVSISGSLLAPGVLRGHQELAITAADVGGGISKVETLVNGLPAGSPVTPACAITHVQNPSFQGTAALSSAPCPPKVETSLNLDTATYPFQQGANTVQVCASDVATLNEPNRTCTAVVPLVVDDSCAESGVAGGQDLNAQFAASADEAVTVPYDSAATVRGGLTDALGQGISGATICVLGKVQGARTGMVPLATTMTDARGHFTYEVPGGPNRKLLLGYRHDTFQLDRTVSYFAHVRPSLRIDADHVHNGAEIHIRGKLPGGRNAGRVVVLQASALHSKRWFTFRRATTNDKGVFHSRYRFEATTTTTTYRIRAEVPRQKGYPWKGGHSKPVLVEVRG